MKRKVMALLLTMVMCLTTIFCMGYEVKAEDVGEDIEFSELLTEEHGMHSPIFPIRYNRKFQPKQGKVHK